MVFKNVKMKMCQLVGRAATIVGNEKLALFCANREVGVKCEDWINLSTYSIRLGESFIDRYYRYFKSIGYSHFISLSDSFIRRHAKDLNWCEISYGQRLSHEIICEFEDLIDWNNASWEQKLDEDMIIRHINEVDMAAISSKQVLSEDFMDKYKHRLDWVAISRFQKLSEKFIEEHAGCVYWGDISLYQKLSEDFIRKHWNLVSWRCISLTQELSPEFIEEFKGRLYMPLYDSWRYKDTAFKKEQVKATGLYECHEDYFIAYKGIRRDRYSKYNFQYQYLPGQTYESWCDCSAEENSFGLSVWDEPHATMYCSELVVMVKVRYEDVGRVVHNGGKIRCFKIEVLD